MTKQKNVNKKTKQVIEFVQVSPGIAETIPIILSKDYKRDWIDKNARDLQAFNQSLKTCPMEQLKDKIKNESGHIIKCPGIKEFLNTGYLIRNPIDFIIETNGDGVTFKSVDMSMPSNRGTPFHIGAHPKEQLHDYSKLPQNTLKTVIKVATGWFIVPNEDYVFIVTPPHYSNEDRFTSPVGIHDPCTDPQVNPFLFWHVLKGRETVKAGTPLCQYIPVPREFIQPDITCRTATNLDMRNFQACSNLTFWTKERIPNIQRKNVLEVFKKNKVE